jgi:hypothetical protein
MVIATVCVVAVGCKKGDDDDDGDDPAWFADAVGMTTGISTAGAPANITFDATTGVIHYTGGSSGDGGMVIIVVPSGTIGSDSYTVTYVLKMTTGQPKITLKMKSGSGEWATADKGYPELVAGSEKTLVVNTSSWGTPDASGTDKIIFQFNNDSNAMTCDMKIISVVKN